MDVAPVGLLLPVSPCAAASPGSSSSAVWCGILYASGALRDALPHALRAGSVSGRRSFAGVSSRCRRHESPSSCPPTSLARPQNPPTKDAQCDCIARCFPFDRTAISGSLLKAKLSRRTFLALLIVPTQDRTRSKRLGLHVAPSVYSPYRCAGERLCSLRKYVAATNT